MKIVAGAIVVTLFLAMPAPVRALAMEMFGNAPAVRQPDWAAGVVEVVNLKSRVYSQWVNGNENFFYRGNALALNEALRQYAAVKDNVRQLILLPGPGKAQSFHGKSVEFDWQLHVPSGIYKAVARRHHAVLTVYIKALKPRPPRDPNLVDKWLGDLNDSSFQIRDQARQQLEKLGNDAKPILRAALKAQRALEPRRRLESLLEKLRDFDVTELEIPKGITVLDVDDLLVSALKALKDPDSTICGMAVQDLSALAPYSDKVVPAMTEMLGKDKHEWVRRVAAGCLTSAGEKAKSAVPMLKKGLDDPDANIRNSFRIALEQIALAKDAPGHQERSAKNLAILKEINDLKHATSGK